MSSVYFIVFLLMYLQLYLQQQSWKDKQKVAVMRESEKISTKMSKDFNSLTALGRQGFGFRACLWGGTLERSIWLIVIPSSPLMALRPSGARLCTWILGCPPRPLLNVHFQPEPRFFISKCWTAHLLLSFVAASQTQQEQTWTLNSSRVLSPP